MRVLCFTVDFDRDVNICIPGSTEAGSLDRGSGTKPRFVSSYDGLSVLSGLLDATGIPATFFAEGRTLETVGGAELMAGHDIGVHGYDHEDLTSVLFAEGQSGVRRVISRASDAVSDATGERPSCFRAPYMRTDSRITDMLPEFGIRLDSSIYSEAEKVMLPREYGSGVVEVGVPEGADASGKRITSYLWQMHEGRRAPTDYVGLASCMEEGIFTLSTHTWHMVESRAGGRMDGKAVADSIQKVTEVLEGICDMGFRPMTLSGAVGLFGVRGLRALR